jgi:multiple sugar transport system substrate-binding protein
VRESIVGDLEDADQRMAEFMSDLEDEIVDGPPVPPNGSAEMQDIMTRINTEVLFGNITPQEAAERFISEVEAAIGG